MVLLFIVFQFGFSGSFRREDGESPGQSPGQSPVNREHEGRKRLASSTLALPNSIRNKAFDSVIQTAIDFHKTQCFFTLAMETASLAAFASSSSMESSSIVELRTNYRMMLVIGLSGIGPVAMMMLLLHIMDQRSSYLLVLSTASAVLSTAITSLIISKDVNAPNIEPSIIVPECGAGNPERFCTRKMSGALDSYSFFIGYQVFGWFLLGLLILDHFLHAFEPCSRRLKYPRPQGTLIYRSQIKKTIGRWAIQLALVFCIMGFLVYWIDYSITLESISSDKLLDWHDWSFGQVVSIAVYVPVLVDLVAVFVCELRTNLVPWTTKLTTTSTDGVDGGIRYRISRSWKLVRLNNGSGQKAEQARPLSAVSAFLHHPLVLYDEVVSVPARPVRQSRTSGDQRWYNKPLGDLFRSKSTPQQQVQGTL